MPPAFAVVASIDPSGNMDVANNFVAHGVVTAGAAVNCRIVLYSMLNTRLWHLRLGLHDLPLLPSGADAYILPAYVTEEVVEYCMQHGATILIYSGEKADQSSIGPANRAAGREATAHLIAHRCRRIVHLAGMVESKEAQGRLLGYRDALAAAGLPYDESLVDYASFGMLEAEAITERLLREGVKFDGAFAANDMSAFGAIHALNRAGLRVPDRAHSPTDAPPQAHRHRNDHRHRFIARGTRRDPAADLPPH